MASMCDTFYGFEPMPATYDILCRNMQINKIENATLYKKGVAEIEGIARYGWIPEGNPGGAALDDNPMGKPVWIDRITQHIPVELVSIDSLHLHQLDFMKIDVEGYETLVIKGAMNTINRCKPIIIMEVWMNHFGAFDLEYTKLVFKDLLDTGYSVIHVGGPDFLFVPHEKIEIHQGT
jgi:FkbM family methyltransferase